jgi:hypothetical protein
MSYATQTVELSPIVYPSYPQAGTPIVKNIPCGGHYVAAVVFSTFDDRAGMSVEIVIHWTRAIEFLKKTGYEVKRVLWADTAFGGCPDLQRWGNNGSSYASSYQNLAMQNPRTMITAGVSACIVLQESTAK